LSKPTLDQIPHIVVDTIADQFGVTSDDIMRETVSYDVDGWDSLQHTILMVRLEKRVGITIDETIASEAKTVGELIDMIVAKCR
jgi:acyl carrier protein